MATRRPEPKRRQQRREREEQRREGAVVVPPPPPPATPTPIIARRPRGGTAGAAAGAAAGGAIFTGGSAASMFGIAAADGAEAQTVAGAVKAVSATLRRIAVLRLAREREALQKAGYEPSVIEAALNRERKLEAEFQRRSAERLRAALSLAARAPDASARAAAAEGALRREQNYSRQRALASGARVFASISQQALEQQSPLGAFWKLGIAAEHTPDCLAMAGKFWPWSVLRRIHPLLHVGCKCRLYSYGEAIAAGWMTPADVLSDAEANRLALPVIEWVERHHAQENEALAELLIREELARIPGADLDFLAAAPLVADEKAEMWLVEDLLSYAKTELKKAGLFDKDSDYEGMLGKGIMKIIKTFAAAGHSGGSAAVTIAALEKLLRYEPLTPLTSDPAEWMKVVDPGEAGEKTGLWQSRRHPAAFSRDGGKTWKVQEAVKEALLQAITS